MSTAQPPQTLTSDEQLKLLKALLPVGAGLKTERKGYRNYLIAVLMLDAGLRVGEVVQLQVSHLLFNETPVNTLVLTSDITKNHKERSVPVSSRLSKAIEDFFSCAFCSRSWDPTYHVFSAPQSSVCITTRQVENIILNAALKSIGRRIHPHMLRHTFGSKLLKVTNIRTVQILLGHTCITSTQIYTHPDEDDKKKAIDLLNSDIITG